MSQAELDIIAHEQPAFANLIGFRAVSAEPDRVVAELVVTEAHTNRNGVMHGGAIMAFADNLGGMATIINIREDQATTTMESKTNFLRPIPVGDTLTGVATPIHKGRTTQVWQTTMTRSDGKVAAIVTQTQIVLENFQRG